MKCQNERDEIYEDRKKADRRGWDLHDFPQQMEAPQSDTQQ